MKKLMVTIAALTAVLAYADEKKPAEKPAEKPAQVQPAETQEAEDTNSPVSFWGFGNYGIYSGYMLYGSCVNPDPTLQGYFEGNAQFNWDGTDLGYLGVGIWSNSDLTGRRGSQLFRAFNEWDFNIHYGRTFWIDDAKTWGIDYRTSIVWYWYPHRNGRTSVATTMDWNHSFAVINPYVIPFLDVVHEFHESNGTLLQFGLKRDFKVCDKLTLTPQIVGVWRNRNYGWCFSGWGNDIDGARIGNCLATGRVQLDATYMFTEHVGIFAKVAFCANLSKHLRATCRDYAHAGANAYGRYNEFVWGGVGLTFVF